jgi:drug/metabolite transporter (DMT)-like permease
MTALVRSQGVLLQQPTPIPSVAMLACLTYASSMRSVSNLNGVAAMLAATASFVAGDSFMKLVTEDLPPFEVLALRGVAASLACALVVALRGEWRDIAGALDRRALLRAAAETLSVLCYIVALARMPIADVIAILQAAPLILIIGAALVLRERIAPARIAIVLIGFGGALMVAQPGANGISPRRCLPSPPPC